MHKNGYYGGPMHPIDPKTISLQSYDFSAATVKILTSCDVGVKNWGSGVKPSQPPKFLDVSLEFDALFAMAMRKMTKIDGVIPFC